MQKKQIEFWAFNLALNKFYLLESNLKALKEKHILKKQTNWLVFLTKISS